MEEGDAGGCLLQFLVPVANGGALGAEGENTIMSSGVDSTCRRIQFRLGKLKKNTKTKKAFTSRSKAVGVF